MSSPTPSTALTGLRSWQLFLDAASFSVPVSLSECSYRLTRNFFIFLPNYAFIALAVFLLTLILRPLYLILFLCIFASWIYLFFLRDEPISLLDYDIDQKIVGGFLLVLTLGAILWTKVWFSVLVATIIGAAILLFHGILRATEDSFENSPYGSLLNVVDSPRGQYSSEI